VNNRDQETQAWRSPLIFTVPAYGFAMDLYLDWLCQSSQVEYAENEAKQLLNRFSAGLRTPNFEPGRTFFSSQRFQVRVAVLRPSRGLG
jgi:hypothetical protein